MRINKKDDLLLHSEHLHFVNGIICDLSVERVSYPTVQEVKNNWQFSRWDLSDVTDSEISEIIASVKRIDGYTGD